MVRSPAGRSNAITSLQRVSPSTPTFTSLTIFFDPAAMEEYIRCYTLKTISGSCRDYRARKIVTPAMIVWGARGHSPVRAQEFLDI
jgi:hypothetical protein